MKKERGIKHLSLLVFGVLIFISSIRSVLAQENAGEGIAIGIAESIKNGFEAIGANPTLLSSILLGILLYVVLYSIVKQIFSWDNWVYPFVVSVIIVILTFIYLPEDFVEAVCFRIDSEGRAEKHRRFVLVHRRNRVEGSDNETKLFTLAI